MKYIRFKYKNQIYWGVEDSINEKVLTSLTDCSDINDFTTLVDIHRSMILQSKATDILPMKEVQLLPPALPTKNIMCIGKNYRSTSNINNRSLKEQINTKIEPVFFSKAVSSIIGPNKPIELHSTLAEQVDYEAELAVIIGKKCNNATSENAMSFVFGYTCLNDITARDLQKKYKQWYIGKSMDTYCPIGPCIVTSDEIENPQDLYIKSYVNGELRQNANTSQMLITVAELIVSFSKGCTLFPGDIIATGTPDGVGAGLIPAQFLKSGDKVEVHIEKIGSLINNVVD